jgi:hypothetical protein
VAGARATKHGVSHQHPPIPINKVSPKSASAGVALVANSPKDSSVEAAPRVTDRKATEKPASRRSFMKMP